MWQWTFAFNSFRRLILHQACKCKWELTCNLICLRRSLSQSILLTSCFHWLYMWCLDQWWNKRIISTSLKHVHDVLQNHWDIDLIDWEQKWCWNECELQHTWNFQWLVDIHTNWFSHLWVQLSKEHHIHSLKDLLSCACLVSCWVFQEHYEDSEFDSFIRFMSFCCKWFECQESSLFFSSS